VNTAFVHVDLDDLWALGECYGVPIPDSAAGFVYEDALPRFRRLFEEAGIRATFFVVGRDLESPSKSGCLGEMLHAGHSLANHGYSHALDFRALEEPAISSEVAKTGRLLREKLGCVPLGFRAPGYAVSPTLLRVLARQDYAYDSSLMPSPFGFVFRWLDSRLRRMAGGSRAHAKTQFPRLADARAPLAPYRVDLESPTRADASSPLFELPVAASPLFRLPFQAGVCMRLGRRYFDTHLNAFFLRPETPFIFLLHGIDLADLPRLNLPFFNRSRFFSEPAREKEVAVRHFLNRIQASCNVRLAEEWIRQEPG
jgi:hypothetical protein